uniref:Flavoprotein domain-containing protein n=1 Tax=Arion vulgaris TaxID=1028688 RepID=A0A0B6ZDI2_9EUPU
MTDTDEWEAWSSIQDPVLHIELRKWADIMLIAPLDANTLAKIATGLCDNLLTCVARAWDPQRALLFAPAEHFYVGASYYSHTHSYFEGIWLYRGAMHQQKVGLWRYRLWSNG